MLIYYSILNTLATVFRRHMSDVLFAPSIIVLCLLHYFRRGLAESGLLSGIDGRIATIVFLDEVAKLKLVEFFSSGLALRLNGNVSELFYGKLGILDASLVLLLFSKSLPVTRDHAKLLGGIEKSLALRAQHVSGLANSHDYVVVSTVSRLSSLGSFVAPFTGSFKAKTKYDENAVAKPRKETLLNGYQLVRLGYVVLSGEFLITFEDWDIITLMAPVRSMHNLWNYREFVWLLKDSTEFAGKETESEYPEVWRVDDPRLIKVPFWNISAVDIRCGPQQ